MFGDFTSQNPPVVTDADGGDVFAEQFEQAPRIVLFFKILGRN
ncbi:adenine methyltransferase [Salmonella phage 19]|nr:adenine methyltransferase [Salmonella phage 19]